MKEQIKGALMKLKEYGWELLCALPFDGCYEIDFEKADHSKVSFVIYNGITLRFANMEAIERGCAYLAFVQLAPNELILFLDICNAVKGLSDEDMYNAIIEGIRGVM